ncbi:MAG: hypothetical protein ABIG87_00985 [Patescibacteria group bacterium]
MQARVREFKSGLADQQADCVSRKDNNSGLDRVAKRSQRRILAKPKSVIKNYKIKNLDLFKNYKITKLKIAFGLNCVVGRQVAPRCF